MTAQLQTINLPGTLLVLNGLSEDERDVYVALTGKQFDADQVAAESVFYDGMHWLITNGLNPIAVGGFIRQRPGVFRTWFYATDAAWNVYAKGVTSIVRSVIWKVLQEGHAHRVETITLASRSQARLWYARIGLALESTLKNYGANGEDAVMYVALKSESAICV